MAVKRYLTGLARFFLDSAWLVVIFVLFASECDDEFVDILRQRKPPKLNLSECGRSVDRQISRALTRSAFLL